MLRDPTAASGSSALLQPLHHIVLVDVKRVQHFSGGHCEGRGSVARPRRRRGANGPDIHLCK